MIDNRALIKRDSFERKKYERLCLVGWGQRIRRRDHPPKNSLPIISLAHELNYDAIEIDVRVSCDNVPVLAHDAETKGSGDETITIAENTLHALRKFRLGTFKGAAVYIPTLVEALKLAEPMDVQIDARIDVTHIQLLRDTVEAAGFNPCNLQFCVYGEDMARELVHIFPESVLLWKQMPPRKPVTESDLKMIRDLNLDGIMVRFPRDEHDFESLTALTRPLGLRVLVYIHGREQPYPKAVNEALDAIQQAGIDYVTTFAGEANGFKRIKGIAQ